MRGASALRPVLGVAAVVVLVFGCGGQNPSSTLPAGSASSGAATAASTGPSRPIVEATPRADAPPDLLIASSDGTYGIVDPAAPTIRRSLGLPASGLAVRTGPASIAAYTKDPSSATHISLGRVVGDRLVVDEQLTAPAGERWGGTYPACLNGAGLVILADAGLRLSIAAPGQDVVPLPGQQSNRGGCVWLDDAHVVWDEEGDRLAMFDLDSESTFQVTKPPIVRNPTGGAGRMAGITADEHLVVATYQLEGVTFTIGAPAPAGAEPGTGELSADGRWLVRQTGSSFVVIDAARPGGTPVATIPAQAGETASWLPAVTG